MNETERLVDSLVSELKPVSASKAINAPAAIWLLVSAVYVVLLTHLLGPLRPNALEQLLATPRFAAEVLLGVTALAMVCIAGFRAAVPGRLTRGFGALALGLAGLWAGGYLVSVFYPALEPSMLGKRGHCYLEGLVAAALPLLVALWWQRRHYALAPVSAAMKLGLVSGGFSALYMQLACMYQPVHNLVFHLGPALLAAACAPLILLAWNRLASRD